jgi:hypothetical protein
MRLEQYQVKAYEDLFEFEFISEGPKGSITKLVQYSKIDENAYNLAFGDKKEGENEIDDKIITDNKDSQKVLATVAATVIAFTEKYSQVWIIASGSSKSRTRLYQIGISTNYEELQQYFNVYGYYERRWVKFQKNVIYDAFAVKRK